MRLSFLSLLLVLAVIALLAVLNWPVFLAPSQVSLGFISVSMPLALVMLALLACLSVAFLLFVTYLQGSLLFDLRRHSRELADNRKLADEAEASRFTELRQFLEAELAKVAQGGAADRQAVLDRLTQVADELRIQNEQTSNGLAASIGELDDRIHMRKNTE